MVDGLVLSVINPDPKPSLLERLGAKRREESQKKGNGHVGLFGNLTPPPRSTLPADLLHPYTNLLHKAGIDSLDSLRLLVRSKTVKEYVDALADKYPQEKLLDGFTARWALRERLEEWLGVKKEDTVDWGSRPS